MIEQRNFVTFLLLNIITCGIYGWYYIYTMTRDINTMVGDDGRCCCPSLPAASTPCTGTTPRATG